MHLDLGMWICMVLLSTPGSIFLCCSVSLHLKRSMPPDIFQHQSTDQGTGNFVGDLCLCHLQLHYDLSLLYLKIAISYWAGTEHLGTGYYVHEI